MTTATIKAGGSSLSLNDLKCLKCILTRQNLSSDTLDTEFDDSSDAQNWKYGQTIELFDGSLKKFRGKISQIYKVEDEKNPKIRVVAKNAFEELEQIVYQQRTLAYSNGILSGHSISRVVLGRAFNGLKLTVAEQARDILEYALSLNADFQIGTIDLDSKMVFDECRDISCAEALCRVLKWSPSCRMYFDYNTPGAPLLHIIKLSALENADLQTHSGLVRNYSAKRREDLSASSVSIKYERENTVDDASYLEIYEDRYPADSVPDKKTIVMEVELSGSKAYVQSTTIKTQTIRPESKDWWRDHVACLQDLEDFELISYSRSGELSYELVEGCINETLNCDYEKDTIKGKISYTDSDGSVVTKDISIRMVTTTAQSGTYSRRVLTQTVEEIPSGLAKAIYEAASPVQYDGSVQIVGGKIENYFGKNITLYRHEEAITLPTPVYYGEEDIANNLLSLKFGPSKNLYPDNIVELFRINRSRKVSELWLDSSSGKINASTSVTIGTVSDTQVENENSFSRLVISSKENDKRIDLNPEELEADETLSLHESYVLYNGYLCKAKIFMTEPQYE